LAYAGMIIHLLLKFDKARQLPNFSQEIFIHKQLVPTIANIIAIPVLLVVIADTSLQEFLPINHVTALLCGYQTQSMFKYVTDKYAKK
jgi:hypothetical protein